METADVNIKNWQSMIKPQKLEIDQSIPRLIISKGGGFKINQV